MVCSPLVRKGVALVLMMAVGQVLAAGRIGVGARADAAVGVTNAIPCPATGWTHSGGDRPTVEATAAGEAELCHPEWFSKRICLVRKPGELVGELGEFRGRKWHRLEGLDGKADFAVDEETQTDLRLFAVPEKIEEARRLAATKL